MNLKHKPTFYPNHAQLLHIGATGTLIRREDAITRVDPLGCWELHAEALEALERAIKIASEDPESRILLDVGDCLCIDDQDWRGDALERIARFSPQQPSGTIVMTLPFQNAIRPHIEDPNDLAPLLSSTPTSLAEMEDLALFQPPKPTPTYARSNFVLEQDHLAGREEEIKRIHALFEEHPSVLIQGNVGTGKTALAKAYAAQVATHAPDRELWWVSLDECVTITDLARRFAQLFALRLGAQEEHWGTRVSAMLAHRPLSPTLILDNVDTLGAEATMWLDHVMSTTPEARWLLTSRRSLDGSEDDALTISNLSTLPLSPLAEAEALALLMQRQLPSPPVLDLEQARQLWRACSGHPAALLHARRHASTLLETDRIEEAFSTSLRLERDWNLLDEETQDILLILGRMIASTSASMLELIANNKVNVALDKLERIGWLQADPSTPQKRWSLPGLFKRFAEKQVDPARLERAVEQRADALLEHLSDALEALRARDQPIALLTLTHHEVDMLDILDWGLEHRTEQTLALVARMRNYYAISHSGHFYLPLLERAIQIAQTLDESESILDELALSQAVFIDYNPILSTTADKFYASIYANAERYAPRSRAQLYYFYATYLEDMLTDPNDLDRCTDLLERAIEVAETEVEDLSRLASAHSALARIELHRGNIDAALDNSMRGREYAIATGSNIFLGMTSFSLHRAYLSMGEREQAKRHGQLALEEMEKAGAAPGAIMALASVGYMHVYEGNAESSRQYLYHALQLSRANSYKFGEMNCHYLLGVTNLVDQRWEHARDHLLEAEKFQISFDLDWNLNQNKIILAIALSGLGEIALAREHLRDASEFFAESSYAEITDMLAMAQIAPDVYSSGWVDRDLAALDKLEEKILNHAFDNPKEPGPGRSILLDFIGSARAMLGQEASRDASPLQVAADGSSFKLPDHNDEVNLSRRRTVKRVLAILARARAENPGEVLDAHTLVERGWPGEVFEVRAGLMRLYVTINTLRKLGLEEILQTHGEGYRLDPDVPIEVIGEPEE